MAEIKFTDQNFEEEVIKSKVPVLVDFWAPWCGPCQMMGPIIEELAKEYEGKAIKIGKINVDENPAMAEKYGVMSIPAFKIFKDGKIINEMVGAQAKEGLKEVLDKLL
jgi:thioredoxin 1